MPDEVNQIAAKKEAAQEEYTNVDRIREVFETQGILILDELQQRDITAISGPEELRFDTFDSVEDYWASENGAMVTGAKTGDEYSAHIGFKIPAKDVDVSIIV